MLAVVKHAQDLELGQALDEAFEPRTVLGEIDAQGVAQSRHCSCQVATVFERDEYRTVSETPTQRSPHRPRQGTLSHPARTDDGHQALVCRGK